MHFTADAYERLLELYQGAQRPLMACHPRDLLSQVRDLARYEGRLPQLNPGAIEWAWSNYFAN
ncbi:hypothetical protein ACHMW6_22565 [Pseudoduganella sp. UC29_106]|uniref:hypothetical protein n=1 Tax=Pseudoduganella sp. UC29_106 TaxID=3374553 RepID=UPI003757A9CA